MRTYEDELAELEGRLHRMADVVETAIAWSMESITERDTGKARKVLELEPRVDLMETETDDFTTRMIAAHQPEAGELRRLAEVIKLTGALERMADHAVSIVDHALSLAAASPLPVTVDLPRLGGLVRLMLRRSLDAFWRHDAAVANQVLKTEETAAAIRDEIFEELIAFMQSHPAMIRPALDLILVARKLERIGDHATDIAEDVIAAKLVRQGAVA